MSNKNATVAAQDDLKFTHHVSKNGAVLIEHHGKLATTMRGSKATIFLAKMDKATFQQQQQLMARMTGNYKRGNERVSKKQPKNR
jgi:succinylglutamate desuccinylase